METINHTKIKQWIEKTIDILEAPEENNLSPEKLEQFKKQIRKLQRTEGLTKAEEAGIEQINELINEAEPFYHTKYEDQKPHEIEKTSPKSVIAQVCLFAVFFWVILFIVIIINISSGSKTDTPQSNSTNNTTTSNDNAQKLQSCIEDARSVAQAAPALDTTGPNETAAINACQAEFPTK
jgi:hypothetical protein